MTLYRYVKAEPLYLETDQNGVLWGGRGVGVEMGRGGWRLMGSNFPVGWIAAVLVVLGGGLLSLSLAPIVAYEFVVAPKLVMPLLSPVVDGPVRTEREGGVVLGETKEGMDLTYVGDWFPTAPQEEARQVGSYSLWIPKLDIDGATVVIGGENLSYSLVHYGGTAFPGQPGNAVIFGHSVLPQFYNPDNYMTIFSTLPTLKKGDEMIVNFDGVTYRYEVEEMFEVQPEDVQILEQKYNGSYLTLVTCVPPGTYLRRLVVRARLVRPEGGEGARRGG